MGSTGIGMGVQVCPARPQEWSIPVSAESERQNIRVLIASREAVTRRSLTGLLRTRPELEVVGEAADAPELLSQAGATDPDVIVVDQDLCLRCLEALVPALRRLECQPKVILLGLSEPEGFPPAASSGAFVSKREAPRQLLTAVFAVQTEGLSE